MGRQYRHSYHEPPQIPLSSVLSHEVAVRNPISPANLENPVFSAGQPDDRH
jgi:hypothetical protein